MHTFVMADGLQAPRVLADLWQLIDTQQWDQIFDLLDPGVRVRYVHTGEVLDAARFVQLNRDYPGRWHASVEDVIGQGDRAVSLTHVTDGAAGYWVASFVRTRAGCITELVEVWTEAGQDVPASRPPGG